MSWNLILAVPQFDHDNVIRLMVLTSAGRGLADESLIGKDDIICFDGIRVRVESIVHHHARPLGTEAPTSVAYCFPDMQTGFFDAEIEVLKAHGFVDMDKEDDNATS